MTRVANYCPTCGARLRWQALHGRQRPTCPACGHVMYFDPKVAVVVFITRVKDTKNHTTENHTAPHEQQERVLLVQRAIDPGKGCWALPAGFVEYDEDPAETAVRETLEETGLHVEVISLLEVFPRRDEGLANIVIAYRAAVVGGTLQADDDAADARWFTRHQLPPLVFHPSITLLGRWARGEL